MVFNNAWYFDGTRMFININSNYNRQNSKDSSTNSQNNQIFKATISKSNISNIQHTSLGQEIVIDSMRKTKRSVRVPLSAIALSWLPERGNNAASQKVFAGLTSLCQTNVLLKKMAESVGINKTVSFHVSRHTFATSAIAAGGDLFTVCKLLGHKDIQTTQIYADVIMPTRIDAVNRLSDFFKAEVNL